MRALYGNRERWRANTWVLSPALIDASCIAGIILLTLTTLLWNYQALPLQYWDESRNANNALEMVLGSGWLVPAYDGEIDHWNTKPPLLIWLIAGLMKLGFTPLLAVRLPSAIAACLTLILVWVAVRYGLRDRFAAIVAAVLLYSSKAYTGIHGAHTGDYDTLLALFTTGYVLSVWRALTAQHAQKNYWIVCAVICLVLAVMTKGPAGAFGVIGLCLFLVMTGQLLRIVNDWRWWFAGVVAVSVCLSYYITREGYDPGYLNAVWINEVSGRYSETNEEHYYGNWFYLSTLFKQFEPGALFLLLVGVSLSGSDIARKRLVQATFFSGAGIVILLSTAKTQLYWYVIPVIPLLSIAAAIAVIDTIRKCRLQRIAICIFCILFLALPLSISVYKTAISLPAKAQQKARISQYGMLFDDLRRKGNIHGPITVIDDGIDNTAGLVHYNPELKFYTLLEQQKGLVIRIEQLAGATAINGLLASCDYKNTKALRGMLNQILIDHHVCIAGYKD